MCLDGVRLTMLAIMAQQNQSALVETVETGPACSLQSDASAAATQPLSAANSCHDGVPMTGQTLPARNGNGDDDCNMLCHGAQLHDKTLPMTT